MRSRSCVLTRVLLTLVAIPAVATAPKAAADDLDRGNRALGNGQYEQAVQSFGKALAKAEGNNDQEAMAMYGLARANAQLCRDAAAEQWFRDSIAIREKVPDRQGAWLTQNYLEFARFLAAKGRASEAVEYYGRAIPLVEALGIEQSDPVGYATVLDGYVAVLKSAGKDQDGLRFEAKAAELRRNNPGRPAGFRPEKYPKDCQADAIPDEAVAVPAGPAPDHPGGKVEATADTYQAAKDTHGVVLLAVDWGRQWNYCGYENVQLQTFAFDRVPVQKQGDREPADLVLKPPPSLLAGPGTVDNYALLVAPGEYALSQTDLKVARSVRKVDNYSAGRNRLIVDGNSEAGSFKVATGEIVYVGHFALECVDGHPQLWRYYIEGKAGFHKYLAERVKPKYPFLDTETVQYRLFKTGAIGNDYELQCYFAPSDPQARVEGRAYDAEDCVAE